jgi:hypothetical protein
MAKVKAVIDKLIEQRLLMPDELEPQLKQASERWDWVVRAK